MQTAQRRRTTWAVSGSVIAHVVVLGFLALQKPMLVIPREPGGPPEAIIPVLLTPRPPPAAGPKAKPEPIRLHRRPQRFAPPEVPVLPIPAPAPPAPPPPPPRGPVALHPAPQPKGPEGDVRTALRAGPVGCANQLAVGLNRAEREHCDEVFGKGAKDATPYATGTELTAAKKAALDRAASTRDADVRYKQSQLPAAGPLIGDEGRPGQSAESMKKSMGVDKTTKVPIPD